MVNKKLHVNHVPLKFILILSLIITVPMIAFHFFKIDCSALAKILMHDQKLTESTLNTLLSHYINKAIILWATLFISSITVVLALTQYCLTHDKVALSIGLAQIMITLYFIQSPTDFYEHPFNTIYVIKLLVYIAPFCCFTLNALMHFNLIRNSKNKLQTHQKELQYIAEHDSLTGLSNRHQFDNYLNYSIAASATNFSYFALFIIDIDNFKFINDTYGHLYGDNLLKQFAQHISNIARQGDRLSRIGGDEFALITTTLQSPSSATILAERIFNGLKTSHVSNNNQITSISMGIAVYPIHGKNKETLIKNADTAMYSAKKAGKNTYRFYSMQNSLERHII